MFYILVLPVLLFVYYLWNINRGLSSIPPEAHRLSPKRWTATEIQDTFDRITKKPIDIKSHLPPSKNRRYVVVGGSGLVGGSIVLQLLLRGQDPKSIRIIDFSKPRRKDLLSGKATEVPFEHADITNEESIQAAFAKPWSAEVRRLPLTVFHTAAIIIPEDRAHIVQHRCSRVNTVGTAHVISAASSAGADVFVATSSGSIAIRPANFWFPPWRREPTNFVQEYPEPSKDQNLRPRNDYCGNYAVSKAQAEDLVLKSNDGKKFRTGCIRPACGVYGNFFDLTVGQYLNLGAGENAAGLPSWISNIIQTFVHMDNVAVAHLLFEDALLTSPQTVSGRALTVTDPNPGIKFNDIYFLLSILTPFRVTIIPPLPMLILAHVLEAYQLTRDYIPLLGRVIPSLKSPMIHMQPAMLQVAMSHQVASNDEISKPPEQGGLGYRGIFTSMEGMCTEIREWIDLYGGTHGPKKTGVSQVKDLKNIGAVPAATRE